MAATSESGTTSPSALLDIYRDAGGTETLFQVGTSTDTDTFVIKSNGMLGIGTTSPLSTLSIQGISGSSDIFAIASSTGANLLTVSHGGNVGIGTTTPKYNLVINGTTDSLFQIATSTNQKIMIIDSNGNIGIGTASPSSKLEVVGDIKASGDITGSLQGNRNAIINGDFNIWQRGTSFAAMADNIYHTDRFKYSKVGTMVHTVSKDTDVPTQAESDHLSNYSLKYDVTTADADIAATDELHIFHVIEGYNFAPFMGKTATLSFWVKAVKTGIYCVTFRNSGLDRSYLVEYTINSASTWEKKTITLTFSDSGGTWNYTNGIGLKIGWTLAIGSNHHDSADTWLSASKMGTSNQVNGADSTDNNFWLAQVQFELGSVATDFEYRQFQDELAKCQRYFFKSYDYDVAPGTADANGMTMTGILALGAIVHERYHSAHYPEMRTNPTIVLYDAAGNSGKVSTGAGDNQAGTSHSIGCKGFYVSASDADTNVILRFHYTASAGL
ncbi:MAG: hypothetical protein HQ537_01915 [Parcubacteria group bacterium]|nr:hypothetical protein [Parcubacteria group bacterium]